MFREILGIDIEPKELNVWQMCLRAVLVFLVALLLLRLANRRFLSKMTPFDVLLGFMLASMLSRTINGTAPLLPTLAAAATMIVLHRVIALLSFHSDTFGRWVKGDMHVLVRKGQVDAAAAKKHLISEKDLLEEARLNGGVAALEQIEQAGLERSGQISVVRKQ